MTFLLLLANAVIALTTIVIIARDNRRDHVTLFSCRNVFLLGFLFFQNFGLYGWLLSRRSYGFWAYRVRDPGNYTSAYFILLQAASLITVYLSYRFFRPKFRPLPSAVPEGPTNRNCTIYAISLSIVASICWGLGFLVLQQLMVIISAGIGATATGIAAYAWFRERQNPFLFGVLVVVAAASCLPQLTEYGRRGFVSLALIIAWVGQLVIITKVNVPKLVIAVIVVSSPMVIVLAAFSEARVRRPKSVMQAVDYMLEADIVHGLGRLANFQGAAVISLWCMENHPKPNKYRHLHSARATVHFFVPRAFWPDKPDGSGVRIPRLAHLRNVGGLNVGAGFIGHAMAEGGFYALLIYCILIGYVLKWMDAYVQTCPHLVYAIPMLCALGQLFATPRGEINFFLDSMFMAIVVSLFIMKCISRFVLLAELDPSIEELFETQQ